jgi:hypothetical protein
MHRTTVVPASAIPSNGTPSPPRPVQRAVSIPELQINTPEQPTATNQGSAGGQDPDHLREQIIGWIRAELLVNRERTGRLTDLRR